MKKLSGVALVLAVASLLAGCQSNGNSAKTSSEKVPSTLNLTIMNPNFGVLPTNTAVQNEWQKEMEAYLGCKLNITWNYVPWADYPTKEQTVEATGSIPDIVTYANYNYNQSAGSAGILLDIAPYIKNKQVPNYQPYIEGTPSSSQALYTTDGHSWGFLDGMNNSHNDYSAQSLSTIGIRFDVFKQNNIPMPDTIDSFEQAALKLKELYPNVYPINISAKAYTLQYGMAQIFHTSTTLYWNGSKFAYGPEEDGAPPISQQAVFRKTDRPELPHRYRRPGHRKGRDRQGVPAAQHLGRQRNGLQPSEKGCEYGMGQHDAPDQFEIRHAVDLSDQQTRQDAPAEVRH